MYHVLVPLDNSKERARKQADYVSGIPCADESVVAVLAHTLTGKERSAPEEMQNANRVDTVRRTREALEEEGVSVETRDLSSPPADGILTLVEEEGFDEVVLGGRKRSPTEKAILGSVTQKVILNADTPVTVTGSG